MSEPMTVRPEIWPVAADTAGIWLVSGDDAWRPALPVAADSEPHADVELELSRHGALEDAALLHSTSWRVDGPSIVLTYVTVIRCAGLVLDRYRTHDLSASDSRMRSVGRRPVRLSIPPRRDTSTS